MGVGVGVGVGIAGTDVGVGVAVGTAVDFGVAGTRVGLTTNREPTVGEDLTIETTEVTVKLPGVDVATPPLA